MIMAGGTGRRSATWPGGRREQAQDESEETPCASAAQADVSS